MIAGLSGIFIAAMMAGLNNRVGVLALADVRGALGFGLDDASWLTTVYSAGELIATPFATWFAITLSVVARLHTLMSPPCRPPPCCLQHDLQQIVPVSTIWVCAQQRRLVPILMMAALKSSASIRLHGLALYAMTATSPQPFPLVGRAMDRWAL